MLDRRSDDIQLLNDGIPGAGFSRRSQVSKTKGKNARPEFHASHPLAGNPTNFAASLLLENGSADQAEWLLSVKDVARAVAVSTATVYGLCESGKLPHVRVLNTIRVSRQDLRRFVAEGTRVGRQGHRGR